MVSDGPSKCSSRRQTIRCSKVLSGCSQGEKPTTSLPSRTHGEQCYSLIGAIRCSTQCSTQPQCTFAVTDWVFAAADWVCLQAFESLTTTLVRRWARQARHGVKIMGRQLLAIKMLRMSQKEVDEHNNRCGAPSKAHTQHLYRQ